MPWWGWTLLAVVAACGVLLALKGEHRGLWLTAGAALAGVLAAIRRKVGPDRAALREAEEARRRAEADALARRDTEVAEIRAEERSQLDALAREREAAREKNQEEARDEAGRLAADPDNLLDRADRLAARNRGAPKLPKP